MRPERPVSATDNNSESVDRPREGGSGTGEGSQLDAWLGELDAHDRSDESEDQQPGVEASDAARVVEQLAGLRKLAEDALEVQRTNEVSLAAVSTYEERRRAHKRAKASKHGWSVPKTRKKRYRHLLKPVRQGKKLWRGHGVIRIQPRVDMTVCLDTLRQVQSLIDRMAIGLDRPQGLVCEDWYDVGEETLEKMSDADRSAGGEVDINPRDYMNNVFGTPTLTDEFEADALYEEEVVYVPWPDDVKKLMWYDNPERIRFKHQPTYVPCRCLRACAFGYCANETTAVFCSDKICNVGARCGNRVEAAAGMRLARGTRGYEVRATAEIAVGTTIAPYLGVYTTRDPELTTEDIEYTLAMQERDVKGRSVYIDSEKCGNITRYMNHACEPNAKFFEKRNKSVVVVVVVAMKTIYPGQEITVRYGDAAEDLWFKCCCGARTCLHATGKPGPQGKASA